MSHVFISYHKNSSRDYARRLADHLIASGFDVWIDDRIDYGTNWEQMIFEAIKQASAVLVIMTPGSYTSRWVQAERLYAEKTNKPIFPVLLDGDIFPAYLGVQVADVHDGQLPPDEFLNDLEVANVPRRNTRGRNVAQNAPPTPAKPHDVQPVAIKPPLTAPTQSRQFEAAMPSQIISTAPTEVWAKISLPDSKGLRGELPAVVPSGDVIGREDARATGFPFKFPLDPRTGEPSSVTVSIRARSTNLTFDQNEVVLELPPDTDSQTVILNATLNQNAASGMRVRVTLDLVYETRVIAQISVSATVEEPVRGGVRNQAWMLAGVAIAGGGLPGAPPASAPESAMPDWLHEQDETPRSSGGVTPPLDDILLPPTAPPVDPRFGTPPPFPPPQSSVRPSAGRPDYDEDYTERTPSKGRSSLGLPLALVSSLVLVAVVVIFLVQAANPEVNPAFATQTQFALLELTDFGTATTRPTQTNSPDTRATSAAVAAATQTAAFAQTSTQVWATNQAIEQTQTSRALTRTIPTATSRVVATRPRFTLVAVSTNPPLLEIPITRPTSIAALNRTTVRTGITARFEGCPTDTSTQLQSRLNGNTRVQTLDMQFESFEQVAALQTDLDLVLWGYCENGILWLRVNFLKRIAPPEVFDLDRLEVSENVESYEYTALVANAAIDYLYGDYETAAVEFYEAARAAPHDDQQRQLYLMKGNSYLFAGQPADSLDAYLTAAQDTTLLAMAYNNRAIAEQEILLSGGTVENVTVESVLTYLETAHQNTSSANQQARILTNIGLANIYLGGSVDEARSRCGDAINFNSDYLMAYACGLAVKAMEIDAAPNSCLITNAAETLDTLTQSFEVSERLGASDPYALADTLYWQLEVMDRIQACGQSASNLEPFRQQRIDLLSRQPILMQPDRFE